jgi:hypothetical protein
MMTKENIDKCRRELEEWKRLDKSRQINDPDDPDEKSLKRNIRKRVAFFRQIVSLIDFWEKHQCPKP